MPPTIKATPVQAIDPGLVGNVYHVGIGTADGATIYGYLLARGTKFVEHTDTQRKDALTSYSSPNLTDRDITNWPRESQGDFSGGGGQVVYVDAKRYWDGELDIRTSGFLQLRPQWVTYLGNAGDFYGGVIGHQIGVLMAAAPLQPTAGPYHPGGGVDGPAALRMQAAVAYTDNDAGAGGAVYYLFDAGAASWTRMTDAPIAISRMSGDMNALYASDGGANLHQRSATGAWSLMRNNLTAHNGIWAVDLGNAGYWLYYNPNRAGNETEGRTLRKIDLTAGGGFPDSLVPWGAAFHNVIDLCAYSSGIAILTATPDGCEVWFHDNSTATRMVAFKSFQAQGICNCMGVLYLVLVPGGTGPAILTAISGGSVTTVFEFVPPGAANGAVVAAGRRVLFMGGYDAGAKGSDLYEYDVITGSLSRHASVNLSAGISLTSTARGGLLAMGDSAAVANVPFSPTGARIYAETSVAPDTAFVKPFMPSGYLISSRYDFQTPGLTKLFRRVTVKHRPLQVGESMKLDAVIDKDPTQHVYGTTPPNPAGATITNSTLGSAQTELAFPINTQGRSLYWVLTLFAGTAGVGGDANSSTPVVFDVSTEISVPFVWEFTVDCTSRRETLDGREDEQQLRGEDLSGFLRYLWLTGQSFVFYHPRGETWNAVLESLQGESSDPMKLTGDSQRRDKDFEGWLAISIRALP